LFVKGGDHEVYAFLKTGKIVYRETNEPDLSWPDKPEMIIPQRVHRRKDYGFAAEPFY